MASGRVSLVLFAAALLILGASALEVTLSSERNPQDIHVDLIDSANTTIRAAVYKFSDDKILEAILDALDRGVRVELVVDLVENEDKDSHANAAAKEGAHVRFYSTSKYEKLHAKFSIFDDEIAVSGSANWSGASGSDNMEIVFVHDDRSTVSTLRDFFDELYDDAEEARL